MGLSELDVNILKAVGSVLTVVLTLIFYYRDGSAPAARLWLATEPSKRWTELFFLKYSLTWISWFGVVVLSGVWEGFGPWEYMYVGLAMAVPCAVAPYWLEPAELRASTPFWSRYWVKANAWIAIFSFIGNYFWTHYFYSLLQATYTFTAHRINFVPIAMFLCTHAYFCTYHTVTTAALRRWWTSATYASIPAWLRPIATCSLIFTMSYITAFTEAFTIQAFPYYAIVDRAFMYTVGCIIYGIYFIVSFPMYYRIDEPVRGTIISSKAAEAVGKGSQRAADGAASAKKQPKRRNSVATIDAAPASPVAGSVVQVAAAELRCMSFGAACLDSLAAGMLVTILLEAWRLAYAAARGTAKEGLLPYPPSNVSIPDLPFLRG